MDALGAQRIPDPTTVRDFCRRFSPVMSNSFRRLIAHDPPHLAMLRTFTAPTVLTRGEVSPPFFGLVIEQIRQSLSQAEVRVIPRAGHVPHATTPGQYVRMMIEVVKGVPR